MTSPKIETKKPKYKWGRSYTHPKIETTKQEKDIEELEKELTRIDTLRKDVVKDCWGTSQIRINRFKIEHKLKGLKQGFKNAQQCCSIKMCDKEGIWTVGNNFFNQLFCKKHYKESMKCDKERNNQFKEIGEIKAQQKIIEKIKNYPKEFIMEVEDTESYISFTEDLIKQIKVNK